MRAPARLDEADHRHPRAAGDLHDPVDRVAVRGAERAAEDARVLGVTGHRTTVDPDRVPPRRRRRGPHEPPAGARHGRSGSSERSRRRRAARGAARRGRAVPAGRRPLASPPATAAGPVKRLVRGGVQLVATVGTDDTPRPPSCAFRRRWLAVPAAGGSQLEPQVGDREPLPQRPVEPARPAPRARAARAGRGGSRSVCHYVVTNRTATPPRPCCAGWRRRSRSPAPPRRTAPPSARCRSESSRRSTTGCSARSRPAVARSPTTPPGRGPPAEARRPSRSRSAPDAAGRSAAAQRDRGPRKRGGSVGRLLGTLAWLDSPRCWTKRRRGAGSRFAPPNATRHVYHRPSGRATPIWCAAAGQVRQSVASASRRSDLG